MNIVVCIKQVPDVDDIKWTPENNLDRSQMLSKINLYDDWALDCAIKIKNKFRNVEITAISMGPNQASEVLDYALTKGATRAILLSDKLFSGSDTLITSEILASAIKKYVSDFDLILTGQMAQDGDTAQVPVSMAQKLGIVDVTNVVKIVNADKNIITVNQKMDKNINVCEVSTPCLIAIAQKSDEEPEIKIDNYIYAQNKRIEVYNAEDLGFEKQDVGFIASPTVVHQVYRSKSEREAIEISENCADFISKTIYEEIMK